MALDAMHVQERAQQDAAAVKVNHEYSKEKGYQQKEWRREDNEYPKMLYHPEWGLRPQPKQQDFTVLPGMPHEQRQAILGAYNAALQAWQRNNRHKIANSKKDEERLIKKGWLLKPPKADQPEGAGFDQSSEEL